MRNRLLLIVYSLMVAACSGPPASDSDDVFSQLDSFDHLPGFYDLYWDEAAGRLIIDVGSPGETFLYQASLARGIGSNDLGLDRGQLGKTAVVEFQRSGPKILLIQHNLDYRAQTDNAAEINAVDESFARAVIWGFEILGERDGSILLDATEFLIRDAHRITARLAGSEEGDFTPDASRSAIYMPNTRAFPDNSEIEAIVTFTGQATGPWLRTVSPDAESFSVHLHHSFIRLPDDDFEPLEFDPRSGEIMKGKVTLGSLRVRAYALGRFSEKNIRPGRPMATLEEVLVPLYLLHRFQLIAVGKLVGGHEYSYAIRGDGQDIGEAVSPDRQRAAIAALINTLSPAVLRVPESVLQLIPPRPPGNPKSRETFATSTGKVFEQFGAAKSAATLSLNVLLEPTRAARRAYRDDT